MMMTHLIPSTTLATLLLLFLLLIQCFSSSTSVYDITAFGARSNSQTNSTQSVTAAWANACASFDPSTVYVPNGTFSVGPIQFRGPCNSSSLTFYINGTLVAPGYASLSDAEYWIRFSDIENLSIKGGTIDGSAAPLYECKANGKNCPNGAKSLVVQNAKNVSISDLRSINSEFFHIVIDESQGVTIQGVQISAPADSPNTDGIHIGKSSYVTILGAQIQTGDDCVSIGPGSSNLWIEQVKCGPGHGISIGSLGIDKNEPGVWNVTVKSSVFTGTQNGVRIKTWARPSNGFVNGVYFLNATMQNVTKPIIINQNYCNKQHSCPKMSSGIQISNVIYENIQGTAATEVAVDFNCSSSNPCTGIQLNNIINVTYSEGTSQASCLNAFGSVSGFSNPLCSCLK